MWRRLFWIAGVAAAVAWFLRRRRPPEPVEADLDPADELRRKLDEARQRDAEDGAPAGDLETRRGDVHERARAAVDEMRDSTAG